MVYIMVWTVFMGAVLVSFEGQHLKMDFFSIMLPSPWKEIINGIAAASFLAVCVFVVPQTWTVLKLLWNFGQRSVVAEIPLVIPHFALLLGLRAHVPGGGPPFPFLREGRVRRRDRAEIRRPGIG